MARVPRGLCRSARFAAMTFPHAGPSRAAPRAGGERATFREATRKRFPIRAPARRDAWNNVSARMNEAPVLGEARKGPAHSGTGPVPAARVHQRGTRAVVFPGCRARHHASSGPCRLTKAVRGATCRGLAGLTQLVECQLPKLDVAGSNPVSRSRFLVRGGSCAAPLDSPRPPLASAARSAPAERVLAAGRFLRRRLTSERRVGGARSGYERPEDDAS